MVYWQFPHETRTVTIPRMPILPPTKSRQAVAQPVQLWLEHAESLGPLMQAARLMTDLERDVLSGLPTHLHRDIAVTGVRRSTTGMELQLRTSNAAITARLRQLTPSLLARLQEKGRPITDIQLRLRPSTDSFSEQNPLHAGALKKSALLSPQALQSLTQLQQSLADSPLRQALQSLLKHHAPDTDAQIHP